MPFVKTVKEKYKKSNNSESVSVDQRSRHTAAVQLHSHQTLQPKQMCRFLYSELNARNHKGVKTALKENKQTKMEEWAARDARI